jgi:hypothetical protein
LPPLNYSCDDTQLIERGLFKESSEKLQRLI